MVLVIGGDRGDLAEVFEQIVRATTYVCEDCMAYESRKPIWVCRRLRLPIDELWPRLRSYG